MKDLRREFAKRVRGSETAARISSKKDAGGDIEHIAFTLYIRRDAKGKVQLINIIKYFWLQTADAEAVPSLEDMKLGELSVIGAEIPVFISAMQDVLNV